MPKIISKSDALKLQKQVDGKKGSVLCFKGSIATIKAKGGAKPKPTDKDALKGLKSNDWIGTEYDFQVAVAKLLDAKGLDWFHCPNEAKRSVGLGAKLKKAGMKAGIPDVIIFNQPTNFINHDIIGLCIELKVGKNDLTDSQKEWRDKLNRNGWAFRVAYGLSDVMNILAECYGHSSQSFIFR